MPYKSEAQRKLFEGCRNNPSKMHNCPPKKVVEKFHQEEYHPETQRAHHEQKKRGHPKYL
jgi:hypothetical protein